MRPHCKNETMDDKSLKYPFNYGAITNEEETIDRDDSTPSSFSIHFLRYRMLMTVFITVLIIMTTVLISHQHSSSSLTFQETARLSESTSWMMIQPKTKAMHFHAQLVDHFNPKDDRTWSHPYFVSSDYFAGPGNPIFVILGGEGPITRILYPFVLKRLAYEFQGFVLQTEHRFYGASQPVGDDPSTLEMIQLFTPE